MADCCFVLLREPFSDTIHTMKNALVIKKKICLIGSFAVGKTSLIEQFVYNRFDETYLTTIGVKISQKILPPVEDHQCGRTIQHTFLIWDIAGIEKFDHMALNYFRGASGALAVADLTRRETIEELHKYCESFLTVNSTADLVIIGNKIDIFHEDQHIISDLRKVAEHYSTDFLLTSAKSGEYVDHAFLMLSKKIGNIS